jgi:hypothetical protein
MAPDVSSAVPVQDTHALIDFVFLAIGALGGADTVVVAVLPALAVPAAVDAAVVLGTAVPTVLRAGDVVAVVTAAAAGAAGVVTAAIAGAADVLDCVLSLELPPQAASGSARAMDTAHGAHARATTCRATALTAETRWADDETWVPEQFSRADRNTVIPQIA